MKKLITTLVAGAVAVGLVGTAVAAPAAKPTQNIVEIAAGNDSFETLVSLVQAAGLAETLSGRVEGKKITVFAPTDAAFKRVPQPILDFLADPANKAALTAVLTYHVVSGQIPAGKAIAAAKKNSSVPTVQGEEIDLSLKGKGKNAAIFINAADRLANAANNAKVVTPNIFATNGVIHVINRVILPPTTVDALKDAGLL